MLIGNAPCSWGVFYPANNRFTAEHYLDQVAQAGYAATELGPYGFLPTDPAALRDALDRRGLSLVGAAHVHTFSDPQSGPALNATLEEIARLLTAVGCDQIVVMDEGNAYPPDAIGVLDAEGWRALCAMTEEARKRMDGEHGVTLTFHPHAATAVEHEHQIDRLLGETGIDLCFDTGHHAFWDQDPLAYMEKVWDRIAYMHLKNVDGAVRARLLKGELTPLEAFGAGIMCPLPDGVVDIAAVMRFLEARGFDGPCVVEQDPSDDPDAEPVVLAARNAEFIKAHVRDRQP